jgi:hypothetical protein
MYTSCIFGADFRTDQPKKFRQQDSGEQERENPWIDTGKIVGGEASSTERPKQSYAGGLEEIHKDVRGGGEGGGSQNRAQGNCLCFVEIKGNSRGDGHNEDGRQNRMRPGAMRCEKGGRAEEYAELINVRNGPGDQHAHDNRPAAAREESSSKREGRERVSGNVHGQ